MSEAARRLVRAANHEDASVEGKSSVPALISEWVSRSPEAEMQSVAAMFKVLQIEADVKKREEQAREEDSHSPDTRDRRRRNKDPPAANASPALAIASRVPW